MRTTAAFITFAIVAFVAMATPSNLCSSARACVFVKSAHFSLLALLCGLGGFCGFVTCKKK